MAVLRQFVAVSFFYLQLHRRSETLNHFWVMASGFTRDCPCQYSWIPPPEYYAFDAGQTYRSGDWLVRQIWFCLQLTHLPLLKALITVSNLHQSNFRINLSPLRHFFSSFTFPSCKLNCPTSSTYDINVSVVCVRRRRLLPPSQDTDLFLLPRKRVSTETQALPSLSSKSPLSWIEPTKFHNFP